MCGFVYDIKKDVPPWGLVNDIKMDDPPGPPYTLRCRRGDWYMILKGNAATLPTLLVPPWDWYMILKKMCLQALPTLRCRRGDWYMVLKRMCFLQTLPTLSGASVRKGLCILPCVWLFIGMCKPLFIGA